MATGDTYNLNPATPRVLPWCGFTSSKLLKNKQPLAKTPELSACRLALVSLQLVPATYSARHARTRRSRADPSLGGGERDRTDDLLLAKQALSQLSYTPEIRGGSGWI